MPHEMLAAEEYIYAKLAPDATLGSVVGSRIYSHVAPTNATFPFILMLPVAATDDTALGGRRGCTEVLYQVTVHGEGQTYGALRDAANRIDAILHGTYGTATAGSCTLACTRDEPVIATTVEHGVRYNALGGTYRLYAGSQE